MEITTIENHLKTFGQLVHDDVDKALPFVERVIDVAGSIFPIVGKVGTPLIQAIIKAEAAAAANAADGAQKLANVIAAVGPQVQEALIATGHDAPGKVEVLVNEVVAGLNKPTVLKAGGQ